MYGPIEIALILEQTLQVITLAHQLIFLEECDFFLLFHPSPRCYFLSHLFFPIFRCFVFYFSLGL